MRTPVDLVWYPSSARTGALRTFFRDPLMFGVEGARRCGPVFRTYFPFAPAVVLAGLDANRFVWRNDSLWTYREAFSPFAEQFGDRYLTVMDGDDHRTKRKQFAPGFRPQTIASTVPAMAEELERVLHENAAGSTDLRALCQRLVIAMTARSVLGTRLDATTAELVGRVEHRLLTGSALGPARHAYFRVSGYRRDKAALHDRLSALLDRDDVEGRNASIFAASASNGAEREERIWDLFLMLSAGAETTSALICWTIVMLALHPEWRDRLRASLATWSHGDAGTPHDHPELFATVLEAERLRPPLPIALRVAAEAFEFGGVSMAAGTRVLHANTVTHFLPDVFERPDAFDPARFLDREQSPREALATFGGGSHVCIGLSLARAQSTLAVGELVRGWDVAFESVPSLAYKLSGALVPADRIRGRLSPRRAKAVVRPA